MKNPQVVLASKVANASDSDRQNAFERDDAQVGFWPKSRAAARRELPEGDPESFPDGRTDAKSIKPELQSLQALRSTEGWVVFSSLSQASMRCLTAAASNRLYRSLAALVEMCACLVIML